MTAASSDAKRRLAELLKARPELARMLLEQQVGHLPPIRPYPRRCGERARYHASWAQQRLWLIDRLEGGAAGYRIALVARILGPLDCKALQRALDALMERHESLRTTFVMEADGLRQEVGSAAGFPLEVLDLSGLGDGERSLRLRRQESDEIRRGFDLETGPLVRGCLVRLGCGEHVLLVTLHHIVGDGWSMGVFCRELAGLYSAFHQGRDNPLAPLAIQYADYARWQQELLRGDALQRQLAFWRESLAGMAGELKLPADRVRPAVQTYRGETLPVMLNPEVTAGLKRLAQRHDVTLFMVLHAAWAILLSRLSGQDDIVIGTPIANRQHPQLEGLIGFFANTLALRARIRPENRLDSLFAEIREGTLRAFAHQDVPFEKVVEAVRPERSLSRNPIFQVMLALQNAPGGELSLQDVKVELEDPVDEPAVFDLFLSLEERGKEIVGSLNFAADLFDRATVERWMRCFDTLLQGMTAAPDCRVGDLSIMPEGELRWVTKELNATGAVYPREKLVQELFEEQAHQCPESVAVEHEGRRLTYGELERRSNQVARYLVDQGLKPDQLVGLCMERGLEMVEGLLGILKAGGAYLPLDPTYPAERLRHMLADAAPQLVLTATELMEMLPATAEKAIKLAEERASIAGLPEESFSVGELGLSSESLVYVIYTSGSTGRPKGTAMRHRSMVNLIEWHRRTFGSSDGKRILQFAALSFDVAFQEIFSTLCTGGTLVLIDESARRDVQAMNALLRRDSIDRLFVPPLMLQSIAELVASSGEIPGDLKDVITAGEQLRVSPQIRELFRKMPGARLHNHYGPTETHVVTSLTLEGDPNVWPELPPVGRPIANTQIYVLDGLMRPVPIGVSGEVYIGGANVARGYLNRPDLTGQRFVADPFSADADARLYKTGDLGRWRADGMLEYLGRNDDQVKIRGFRIELGEVEAQLARHGQVKEAAVVVREDAPGQKRLVAYLVPRGEGAPGSEELRAHLKSALPDYMVPGAFVVLERLPLTPSGKLDRRALPAPDLSTYASHEYEPPRGEVEEVLAAIWQELLGLERVGRGDNFFELGGHSLLIVQMLERMRRVGLSAEVRRIFESPTLAALAGSLVRGTVQQIAIPPNLIPPGCRRITPQMLPLVELQQEHIDRIGQSVSGGAANVQDIYPLVPLQEGILFHHLLGAQSGDTYVLPMLLSLPSRERLDALIDALQKVIDCHDILRTAVLWEGLPRPVQVVYRQACLPVEDLVQTGNREMLEQMKARMAPELQRLDLRQAPLLRVQIAPAADGLRWYALLQMHHLLCDHESLELMLTEVMDHMEGRAQCLPRPLAYRVHVAQALACARAQDDEAFFRSKLADVDEPTAPFGLREVRGDGRRIDEISEALSEDLRRRARTQARRLNVTVATLFHAVWGLVLARTTGREQVVFGNVLMGRLHGSAGARRIMGMFINTLPLRLTLKGATTAEFLRRTQKEVVDLLTHEQASLALAQRCSAVARSTPLFSTLLNYRHSALDLGSSFSRAGMELVATEGWTNYPMMFAVDERVDDIVLEMAVDRSIGPRRMLGYVRTALQSVVESLEQDSTAPVLSLAVLPADELIRVTQELNATRVVYPRNRAVHELFEEQARSTPDEVAVQHQGGRLTYGELNRRANQLARYLVSQGVRPDQVVGICVERSLEMVVGLLGIMKAGGAYLPLDPNLPSERLQQMLEDAAPQRVLTQTELIGVLPASAAQVIAVDERLGQLAGFVGENLRPSELGLTSESLVYVIYTSGSTGRPKGTAMRHRSMVNLIEWHRGTFGSGEGKRVLQFAALSFDVAFQELFSTLCTGGTLVLIDEWVRRDVRAMSELLQRHAIERLFVPPLMLQSLAEYVHSAGQVPVDLEDVIIAGEQLRVSPQIRELFRKVPGARLRNHYGPTETHVVTELILEGDPEAWPELPPIGRPIANTQVYVLDGLMQPAPVEVSGEIHIGGANVARGYLNRPDLTEQRFVADPFSADPDARLYKTGDLGRWRADGTLEYLGRNDDQVKIRGFRIEPGEIEAQLSSHPLVKEAAVIAREDVAGEKRLVAYVTRRGESSPGIEDLRAYLKARVPEYMVPSAFVVLAKLPLTPSGKLDRRSLPAPDLSAYVSHEYEPPRGEVEEVLSGIWQELLGVAPVGRNDNFFELGGHSLLVLRVISIAQARLAASLTVSDLMRNPTIESLANCVQSAGVSADPSMHAVEHGVI